MPSSVRQDPFEEVWPSIVEQLRLQPRLQARTLFDDLVVKHPGRFDPGQLRTLQRRMKQWRAEDGPEKELFFAQEHRPGEAMQTDFTSMNSLGITIAGQPYDHLLCHSVLPYSDWSWGTPCRSESEAALRKAVPAAVLRLGRKPEFHQTDNSTAATHRVDKGRREFNADYLALMKHVGMKPRTIKIRKCNQNGDVEAGNGALKRYIDQQLMLRDDRDFATHDDYVAWLCQIFEARNRTRGKRLEDELAVMELATMSLLPEYSEIRVRVSSGSTIRVKSNTYSVPSQLRDEHVKVRIWLRRRWRARWRTLLLRPWLRATSPRPTSSRRSSRLSHRLFPVSRSLLSSSTTMTNCLSSAWRPWYDDLLSSQVGRAVANSQAAVVQGAV